MRSAILAVVRWSKLLAGVISALALGLLCFDVVTRYFFPRYLPDWSSEIVIYMVAWALFLAVGELAIEGRHVHANIVVDHLPAKARWIFAVAATLGGLAFSVLFLWYGWEVVAFAHMIGEEGETSLRFPKYIYYLALPVGMAIQCLGYAVRLWDQFHGQDDPAIPLEPAE